MAISIIVMAAIIILDRIVKSLSIQYGPENHIIIDKILGFTFLKNTGAAYSFLSNHTWILIVLTIIFCIVLAYFVFFKKLPMGMRVSLSCVLAGGFSNLVDRVYYGYVIDMFETKFITFPVFNVADIFITCGGIVFILFYIFYDSKQAKVNKLDTQDKD